ncbi:MAG TPA: hypothetical protein VLS89_10235 [Candidatus Nanopelagicales bacterium]|nr:hypothetical protein [Candidatus Nanopelagicales bacterium]
MRTSAALLLSALLAAATACGASLNAVYEGDVRFEHCMALDSRTDVKPTIRRACWEEWVTFYTFGQTRDRVDYATARQKQLSKASDFDEGDWVPPSSRALSAVPEPTSALAPPPMMLVSDAGPPPEVDAEAPLPPAPDAGSPPGAECTAECEESWELCRQDCKSPACDKSCAAKYKRCMRRCL